MKLKYLVLLSLAGAMLFSACAVLGIDAGKVMQDVNIDQVNKNQGDANEAAGNPFTITYILKNYNILPTTSVSTDGNIPIIAVFQKGNIANASDIDFKIYTVKADGTRGVQVSIKSNKIINAGFSSYVYYYTEDLNPTLGTNFEILVTAAHTKSSTGQYFERDGDGIGGESEDDLVVRFSTVATLNTANQPAPQTTLTVPNLNPGNINAGNATTNTLTDITNGSDIDTSSLVSAISLYSLTENKSYSINISYISTNIIIKYPSSLPLGAYKLTVDRRLIKENSPINGYVHRGSYNNGGSYVPDIYNVRIRSTNTLPNLSVSHLTTQVADVKSTVPLDMSTINGNTVLVYDNNAGRYVPVEIQQMSSTEFLVSAKDTDVDFDNTASQGHILDLRLILPKIKSSNGDVAGFGTQSYL